MRRGFTLLELMVVLAMIAILVALVVPNIDAMYGDVRLGAAVDQIRARWADARSLAIEEGRPYCFGLLAEQNAIRVAPDSPDQWGGNGDGDMVDSADDAASGQGHVIEETLSKGVRFSSGDNGSPDDLSGDPSNDPGGGPVSVAPASWTRIVTFKPDGTTEQDVEIVFRARNARSLKLKLRALTGAVTVETLPPGS